MVEILQKDKVAPGSESGQERLVGRQDFVAMVAALCPGAERALRNVETGRRGRYEALRTRPDWLPYRSWTRITLWTQVAVEYLALRGLLVIGVNVIAGYAGMLNLATLPSTASVPTLLRF